MRKGIFISVATAAITTLTLTGTAGAYVRVTTEHDRFHDAKFCYIHTDGDFGEGSVISDRFNDPALTFGQRFYREMRGLDFIDDLLALSPSDPSERLYITEEDIPEDLAKRITSQGFDLNDAVFMALGLEGMSSDFSYELNTRFKLPRPFPNPVESEESDRERFDYLKESVSETDFSSLESFNRTSPYEDLYELGDSPGMMKLKEAAFQKLRPSIEASFKQLSEMNFEQYREARISDWETREARVEACRKWKDGRIDPGEIPDYAGNENSYNSGMPDPGPGESEGSGESTPTSTTPTSTTPTSATPTSTTPTSTTTPTAPSDPEPHQNSGVEKRLTVVVAAIAVIAAIGGLFAWLAGLFPALPALF